MEIDRCLAAVQLLENRREFLVARIDVAVARRDAHAVGLQLVEGIFDFLQRAVDIEHRQEGEEAEASRIVRHHLRAIVVDGACVCTRLEQLPYLGHITVVYRPMQRRRAIAGVTAFWRHLRRSGSDGTQGPEADTCPALKP